MLYAHSPGPRGWHPLDAHLTAVADRARARAEPFGAGELAWWAGFCHDLGKINPQFQEYLQAVAAGRDCPSVPHAIWGAALIYHALWRQGTAAQMRDPRQWQALALPIYGHHAGLPNGGTVALQLEQFVREHPGALVQMVTYLQRHKAAFPPLHLGTMARARLELFIRMVYSALVDADFLDTEQHFNPAAAAQRGGFPGLAELLERLVQDQSRLMAEARDTHVNRIRRDVYDACWQAAQGPPGVYRLTVPTGGGKTRSGLAFALRHAVLRGLRRVVVAIPYTSIIDQTVTTYREILGSAAVLEHHSQVKPPEDETQAEWMLRQRLATENWDAPLIVTTTVQLFESLFADRPYKVRKLHNLARSVIVLDEVQSLPPELTIPTLDVLRALVEAYGVTLVLCTATQPAFEEIARLAPFHGLPVTEIVPDYPRHFAALQRVTYQHRTDPLTWEELAEAVARRAQVMVVLNRRRDALDLLQALGRTPSLFHMSTLLCPAHRRAVLAQVKELLSNGEPVRLISTQVVEAGVDLDFPEVWRAVGPLDRIVQAAGRCNREGKPQKGVVVIFVPAAGGSPRGPYRVGMEKAALLLAQHGPGALHDPSLLRQYFHELYATVNPDAHGIQPLREDLNYPEVANRYRLIVADTVPVVVDYRHEGFRRLHDWLHRPGRDTWQALQPYVVNLFRHEAQQLHHWLDPVSGELYRWIGPYDELLGLAPARLDASDLIV